MLLTCHSTPDEWDFILPARLFTAPSRRFFEGVAHVSETRCFFACYRPRFSVSTRRPLLRAPNAPTCTPNFGNRKRPVFHAQRRREPFPLPTNQRERHCFDTNLWRPHIRFFPAGRKARRHGERRGLSRTQLGLKFQICRTLKGRQFPELGRLAPERKKVSFPVLVCRRIFLSSTARSTAAGLRGRGSSTPEPLQPIFRFPERSPSSHCTVYRYPAALSPWTFKLLAPRFPQITAGRFSSVVTASSSCFCLLAAAAAYPSFPWCLQLGRRPMSRQTGSVRTVFPFLLSLALCVTCRATALTPGGGNPGLPAAPRLPSNGLSRVPPRGAQSLQPRISTACLPVIPSSTCYVVNTPVPLLESLCETKQVISFQDLPLARHPEKALLTAITFPVAEQLEA